MESIGSQLVVGHIEITKTAEDSLEALLTGVGQTDCNSCQEVDILFGGEIIFQRLDFFQEVGDEFELIVRSVDESGRVGEHSQVPYFLFDLQEVLVVFGKNVQVQDIQGEEFQLDSQCFVKSLILLQVFQ